MKDKGATVRQMRRDDTFVELDDRCTAAAAWGPDLFISLHHNSVSMESDPLGDRGSKVYYHYPHSRALAQAIGDKIEGVVASNGGAAGASRKLPCHSQRDGLPRRVWSRRASSAIPRTKSSCAAPRPPKRQPKPSRRASSDISAASNRLFFARLSNLSCSQRSRVHRDTYPC